MYRLKIYLTSLAFLAVLIPILAQNSFNSLVKADELYKKANYKEAAIQYSVSFSNINQQDCNEAWLKSLHNWGMSKIFSKDESGYTHLKKAESCAKTLGLNELCANLKLDHSEVHKVYQNINAAKKITLDALRLEGLSLRTKGELYAQLAHCTRLTRNDSCTVFANKAIIIGEKLRDTSMLISAYSAISIFDKNNNNFHKAIESSQSSLQYQHGIYSFKRPQTFFNIAELFIELKDYVRGQTYIDSVLVHLDQKKYIGFTGRINYSEAKILEKQGKRAEAKSKYKESIAKNKTAFLNMMCFQNLAHLEEVEGNKTTAKKYLQNAIELCKDPKIKRFENKCIILKAEEAYKSGKHITSVKYLKQFSTQKNIELHLTALPEINLLLAKNYQKLGNPSESLKEYKKYYILKDSLDNLINNELVYSLENKFTSAKQDNILNGLKSQNELQDLELLQQRWKGFAIVAFLFLFSGAFVSLARQNKKIKSQTQTLTTAVNEKNILLKEIHHRVKNNLQVITSLFKLQSRHITDKTALAALQEGRNRVNSMAILHQNLYQEDNLKGIEMSSYVDQLCDAILNAVRREDVQITYQNKIPSIILDIDTVIPMGLILTEFITRSLKLNYTFVEHPSLTVILIEKNNELHLTVADNGRSLAQNRTNEDTFSQKIINAFSIKLKATYKFSEGNPNQSILTIKKYKKAKSN